jgi:predicted DNA-binding antitoxin AbrB/MazE fold protein
MREIKDIDFDFKYENGTFRVLVKVSMTDGAKVSYLIDAKTGEFITENVEEETEEESKEDKNNGFGGGFRDGRTGNKGR